jgi:hypothetical protein
VSEACAFYHRSFLASVAQHEQAGTKAKHKKKVMSRIAAKKKAKEARRARESNQA